MTDRALSFEDFTIDADRRELRRGGLPIALGPQVFDLLLYLIERRAFVVSKDDLIQAVWRGRIVSDSTLTSHVNALRKALGDTGKQQRLIRTLPRKGIRFVGEVRAAQMPSQVPAVVASPLSSSGRPAIAVLPFANMSGDPGQEYLSDGVAEDVITALSRYPSLFVIARNSSFTYRGRIVDLKQVGRELGVRYVLEGSLRQAANRIRLTAQLIETETGRHIWAERYDRDITDVFAVQDEITYAVTTAIAPAIADAERHRALRRPPDGHNAWSAYQRGLWHLSKANPDENRLAQQRFEEAISLDPNHSGNYSGLALALLQESGLFGTRSVADAKGPIIDLALRAVALDDRDAEAHACLSWAMNFTGDCEGALVEARRALAISPNLASAHRALGTTLIFSGDPAGGLAALETCLRLDPRDPLFAWHLNRVAIGHYYCRNYEAAIDAARQLIRTYPDFPLIYRWYAAALGQAGRTAEAKAALDKAISIAPASFDMYVRKRVPWHRAEDHEHMLDGLRKAGWAG